MIGEHITRESLVDMFASLDNACRVGILTNLEKSIAATEEDATSGNLPMDDIGKSLQNLLLMQSCCQQAHNEFHELSEKTA